MHAAVVLLSGGLDSATAAAVAKREGFAVHAISFRHVQRHVIELAAVVRVAKQLEAASHRIIDLDVRAMSGSALTDESPVPKDRSESEMILSIPVAYVPARNTIFLAHALGFEVLNARDVFVGVNPLDCSGYPDCRPRFIQAFETLSKLGTKAGIEGARFKIHAPLMSLTKARIIKLDSSLGVGYVFTSSCYEPSSGSRACGHCDSCPSKLRGFAENKILDPIRYIA